MFYDSPDLNLAKFDYMFNQFYIYSISNYQQTCPFKTPLL